MILPCQLWYLDALDASGRLRLGKYSYLCQEI